MAEKYPAIVLILVIAIAAILAAGCTQPSTGTEPAGEIPDITVAVPDAPVPVQSLNGVNIAYELELTPAGRDVPVIDKVEVLDLATGLVLYSADGELLEAIYHPGSVPPPSAKELQDGTGKLRQPRISLWFVVSPGSVPDRLTHRLTLNRSANGLAPVTITGGDVVVRKDLAPVVIGSPLKGDGWLAMETTSPLTHHFRAQLTMNNVTRVPQRYAQDWILLDPVSGKAASGNVSLARNYYGFGKEIYAVADGTVAEAQDGIPDFETIYSATGITIATAGGNSVILDLGNGKYACYGHMVNGSVRVKKGDIVKEGQVIGLVGNSGNSDIPHLHFQVVTDTPSFLGAEGYPHVYRSFTITGAVNDTEGNRRMATPGYTTTDLWREIGDLVMFYKDPIPQQDRLMENNAIVSLP